MPCSRAIQTLERLRFQSAARIGSCTVAFLRRGVPLPSDSGLRSLAGRLVLPSSPGGTHGVSGPSQSCSRHGWGDISAIPGPRAVRATYPPRLIFVGVILIVRSESHWNRSGQFGSGANDDRLLGFAPVCGPRPRLSSPRAAILPWALPLAGLRTHIRASVRARHRIGSTASVQSVHAPLHYPLMGFANLLRVRHVGECHRPAPYP